MIFCEESEIKEALAQNFKSQTFKILAREIVDASLQEKLSNFAYEQDIAVEEVNREQKLVFFGTSVKEKLDELWFQDRKAKKEQIETLEKKKIEINDKIQKGEEVTEEELQQIQVTFPFVDIYVWFQNFPMNHLELYQLEKIQLAVNVVIYIEPRIVYPEEEVKEEEEGDEDEEQKEEEEEQIRQAKRLEFKLNEIAKLKGEQWKLFQKFQSYCRLSDMKSLLRNTFFFEQSQPEPPEEGQASEDEDEEEKQQKPPVDLNGLLWTSFTENLAKISQNYSKFLEWLKLTPIFPIAYKQVDENAKKSQIQFSLPDHQNSINPEQEQDQHSKLEESQGSVKEMQEGQQQEDISKIISDKQGPPIQVIPTSGIDDEPRSFDLSAVFRKIKQIQDLNLTAGVLFEAIIEKLCGNQLLEEKEVELQLESCFDDIFSKIKTGQKSTKLQVEDSISKVMSLGEQNVFCLDNDFGTQRHQLHKYLSKAFRFIEKDLVTCITCPGTNRYMFPDIPQFSSNLRDSMRTQLLPFQSLEYWEVERALLLTAFEQIMNERGGKWDFGNRIYEEKLSKEMLSFTLFLYMLFDYDLRTKYYDRDDSLLIILSFQPPRTRISRKQ